MNSAGKVPKITKPFTFERNVARQTYTVKHVYITLIYNGILVIRKLYIFPTNVSFLAGKYFLIVDCKVFQL